MQSVDILLVIPLSEELETFRDVFDFKNPFSIETHTYYINYKFNGYSLATVCIDGMGNTNAATVVTNALYHLHPTYIFMFGVACGIGDNVNLADVIIPESIFYYALGKQYPDRQQTRLEPLRIDALLIDRIRAYQRAVAEEKSYRVVFGPFAVGEEVVQSQTAIKKIVDETHPKLVGLDMESYGAGLAVFKHGRQQQFVSIRGVSDHGTAEKNDLSRPQALANAADFMLGFIKSGSLPKSNNQPNDLVPYIAIHHLSLYRRPSIRHAVDSYLRRLQSFEILELLVDQVDLFVDGSMVAPIEALDRQIQALTSLEELIQRYPNCEIGYFSLAHIPLMFQLGYEINRRTVEVFHTAYSEGPWIDLPATSTNPAVIIEGKPIERNDEHGDVILLMSISYDVISGEPMQICEHPMAQVHIRSVNPAPGIIDSHEVLNRYVDLFREFLTTIHSKLPNARRVHVFFAGPPALALRCGQQINRNIDPEIVIYNYSKRDNPHYRWGINLQTREVIERKAN